MYWSGSDPDGSVAYYEIAVTDSNEVPGEDLEEGTGYTRTLKTDSLFTLRADPPIEQQILGHRLYVRSVDNEGKIDPTPALAYFVAKNDFYPQVDFRDNSGSAHWVDKCGNEITRPLGGIADTIGVEGCARWTWSGFDGDEGGHVRGFVWKMSSQTRYTGGGPGDTLAEICFPPNSSRRQTLQVRAIDDGGLRSIDDFTRIVILNFDPITMILHPDQTNDDGTPKRAGVFLEPGQGVWPSGTTLPDVGNVHEIEVFYSGYDDPRDKQASCDEAGVHKYQTRVLFRDDSFFTPAGPPFEPAPGTLPYPEKNSRQYFGLDSGDSFILIRSVDDFLVVDSTPETVLVRINYSPYITQLEARPSSHPSAPPVDLLAVRNSTPGNPIRIQLAAGESLQVTVKGRDIHFPNPMSQVPPDLLAAAFDSNAVVAQELGNLNEANAYRIFFDTVIEPGYEPAPDFNPDNPFTATLEVEGTGVYKLIADVQDRTNNKPIGRRGRIIRYIEVVR